MSLPKNNNELEAKTNKFKKKNNINYNCKEIRSCTKMFPENTKSHSSKLSENHKINEEDLSDDDIIKNSQNSIKSKLHKKLKRKRNESFTSKSKTLLMSPKSETLLLSPKKEITIGSPKKILRVEVCDINSIKIKKELTDVDENINHVTHNLSDKYTTQLPYSIPTFCNVTIDETVKKEDISIEYPILDPLRINKKNGNVNKEDEQNKNENEKEQNENENENENENKEQSINENEEEQSINENEEQSINENEEQSISENENKEDEQSESKNKEDKKKTVSNIKRTKRKVPANKSNLRMSKNASQKDLGNDESNETENPTLDDDNLADETNEKIIKKDNSQLESRKNKLLSEELEKKLKTLKIQLQHEVPPQHKIKKDAGARTLNKIQLIEFEMYGPLKKGSYTASENKIIKRNWENFCKIHNWNKNDTIPFLNSRYNGKYYLSLEERKKFVQFLANGLPWRSLFSVNTRFKNLVDVNVNKGIYNLEEDEIIIKNKLNESKSSNEVGEILNRKKRSILYRFQRLNRSLDSTNISKSVNETKTLKDKPRRSKSYKQVCTDVTWNYIMVVRFLEVLTLTSCCKLEKLKNIIIDQNIWNEMETIININRKTLKDFWYFQLHMQIFSPTPIYLNDLKIKLIQYMYEKKITVLEDIKWEDVCLNFDGITSFFLSKLFNQLIQKVQTKTSSSEIKDIVKYLYHEHIPKLKENSTDAILPKLYCKKNKIIKVDTGTERKIPNQSLSNPFTA